MQTPDTLDKELVASVVDVENGGKDGNTSPYHAFEKVYALAKRRKLSLVKTCLISLNLTKK